MIPMNKIKKIPTRKIEVGLTFLSGGSSSGGSSKSTGIVTTVTVGSLNITNKLIIIEIPMMINAMIATFLIRGLDCFEMAK
jgi:hypothetical protein